MGWRSGESVLNWGYKTNQNNFVSIRPAGPRHHINVRRKLRKFILQGSVQAAAREHWVDALARSYSVWSHLAAMVFVQLAHAFSLK
jgi:hypothetical protein